jgi:hypothetical protein
MTNSKLLSDLLRMKGFKVTWFAVLKEQCVLHLGVKSNKTQVTDDDCTNY